MVVMLRLRIGEFGYLLNDVKRFVKVCARTLFGAIFGLSKPFWFLTTDSAYWLILVSLGTLLNLCPGTDIYAIFGLANLLSSGVFHREMAILCACSRWCRGRILR